MSIRFEGELGRLQEELTRLSAQYRALDPMLSPEPLSDETEVVGEEGANSGLTGSWAWHSARLCPLHPGFVPTRSSRTGDIDGGEVPVYTFFWGPPL